MSDPYEPARLLSGQDRMSRVEKDAILEKVLDGVAPVRARWWMYAAPALVAAAAVIALVVWPRERGADEFGARGSAAAVATFAPACGAQGCERGGKLLFDLHGTTGYTHFAAFARRASDGVIIWYVPDARPIATQQGVLGESVVLGPEHEPGTYRVYGVFANVPLDRAAIKALFDDAGRVKAGVAVVEKEIVIR